MLDEKSSSLLKVDDELLEDDSVKLLNELKEKRNILLKSLKEKMDLIKDAEKKDTATSKVEPEEEDEKKEENLKIVEEKQETKPKTNLA